MVDKAHGPEHRRSSDAKSAPGQPSTPAATRAAPEAISLPGHASEPVLSGKSPLGPLSLPPSPIVQRSDLVADPSHVHPREVPPGSVLARLGAMYRQEWPSIPASLLSSVLAGAISVGILATDTVTSFIRLIGNFPGAALSLGATTVLWYKIFSKIGPSVGRLFGKNTESPSNRWFFSYMVLFNCAQLLFQTSLLASGIKPAKAQILCSIFGTAVWLAALPFAKYRCAALTARRASRKAARD